MIRFAKYAPDGRIIGVGICQDDDVELQGDIIEIGNADVRASTHYVTGGELALRATLAATWNKTAILANGTDAAILSPVPAGTVFEIDGTTVTVNDGALEVVATLAGTYWVRSFDPRYVEQFWKIEAT